MAGSSSNASNASNDRRRGQRARLVWKGTYLLVGPFTSLIWHRCYLVDVSESGAAIEVHGDELDVGQRVLVRLDSHPSYSDAWLQLRATVVNRRGTNGTRVYGLAFEGLIPSQREHFLQITMAARRNARRRRDYGR